VLFVLAARSASQLSVPGLERGGVTRSLPIVSWFVWVLLIAARWVPGTHAHVARSMVALAGLSCAWRMTWLALAPTLALIVMLRQAAPLKPGWTGLFALLSASSVAILGTQLLCAKDDARHILLWHVSPVVVAAMMGVCLGKWLLRERGRQQVRRQWLRVPPVQK
jgi:hypothetical protein